ncbi:MAG: hypothetical protein V2G41_09815 [bacterium JZ-2024 1]
MKGKARYCPGEPLDSLCDAILSDVNRVQSRCRKRRIEREHVTEVLHKLLDASSKKGGPYVAYTDGGGVGKGYGYAAYTTLLTIHFWRDGRDDCADVAWWAERVLAEVRRGRRMHVRRAGENYLELLGHFSARVLRAVEDTTNYFRALGADIPTDCGVLEHKTLLDGALYYLRVLHALSGESYRIVIRYLCITPQGEVYMLSPWGEVKAAIEAAAKGKKSWEAAINEAIAASLWGDEE